MTAAATPLAFLATTDLSGITRGRAIAVDRLEEAARKGVAWVPVNLCLTAFGTIENAVEAMKLGAFDFIQKPLDVDHLLLLLRRCREHRELRYENLLLKEEFQKRYGLPAIVGGFGRIAEHGHLPHEQHPVDGVVVDHEHERALLLRGFDRRRGASLLDRRGP